MDPTGYLPCFSKEFIYQLSVSTEFGGRFQEVQITLGFIWGFGPRSLSCKGPGGDVTVQCASQNYRAALTRTISDQNMADARRTFVLFLWAV